MKTVYLILLALALALTLKGMSDLTYKRALNKQLELLEHKCDSLQEQIDFMVE